MQTRRAVVVFALLCVAPLWAAGDRSIKEGDRSEAALNKIDTGFFLLLDAKDPPQDSLNKIDTGFFLLLDPKEKSQRALNRIDTGFFLLLDRKEAVPPSEVELGRQLFFDPRLSAGHQMSCATCHDPAKAFSDGRARARGLLGQDLQRNTPTLLNVHSYQGRFFWDGRAASLEEAALTALQSRLELNRDLRELVVDLNRVPDYAHAFTGLYGLSGISPRNIARAIAQFIRAEVRPGETAFDRFRRDRSALSASQVRGLDLFTGKAGCVRCHSGPAFSDAAFHNTGLRPVPGVDDVGRFAVAPAPMTWRAYRTVALRNVARTAPYMHDGSLATLEDVVRFYDRGGDVKQGQDALIKPLGLSAGEQKDLVAFLRGLDSEPRRVAEPKLPAAGGPASAAQAVQWDRERLAMADYSLSRGDRLGLYAAAAALRDNAAALGRFSGRDCAADVEHAAYRLGLAAEAETPAALRRHLDAVRALEAECATAALGRPADGAAAAAPRRRVDPQACRKDFSLARLIGDLDGGKFSEPERQRIESDVVEPAMTYFEYKAFAAGDPDLCRGLGGLRNTNFGLSKSAEWYCREWFYDLSVAQAMMQGLPDLEARCRRSHAHDYPSAPESERDAICAILAADYRRPEVLCGKLVPRFMGGENLAACVNEFRRYGSETYIGESQKGAPEMMYQRYRSLDLFAKAWRAKDAGLCAGSETCRVLMGGGAALAPAHAEKAREAYCGLLARSGADGAR